MTQLQPIKLTEAVEQVVSELDGSTALDEVVRRVLAIWPSKAKNPESSVRTHLRMDAAGVVLVMPDSNTVIPLKLAMRGVRFRIPLTKQALAKHALLIHPYFDTFLRRGLNHQQVQLLDQSGRVLAARPISIEQQHESSLIGALFGSSTYQTSALELKDWFQKQRMKRGDSIIVTVDDWEAGRFRLEVDHHPDRDRIERQNKELSELLFGMLEETRNEMLFAHVAVPTAYARLSDPRGYPGDHWTDVITRDPRMLYNGFGICYSEHRSFFDVVLGDNTPPIEEEPFSKEAAKQVYRFKAALWHRPKLWRTIEIQGSHTLAQFDVILREAFQHDTMDHLGGFWKLVPRGTSKRVREVDLGDIDPTGEGSGAELHVAGLGLKPGDQLKYVYDFGDWIEHHLMLEDIAAPTKGVKYPRIAERNKPRYTYCPSCREEGKKTVANWICIDCSNRQGREVAVCSACLEQQHEDHYADEMLY